VDGYRYSTFFYKQRNSDGGKMFAGPLWDFDLGFGNLNYSWRHQAHNQWGYLNYGPNEAFCMHWWARLMEDPVYVSRVKTRYSKLRSSVLHSDSVMFYIDRQVDYLGDAIDRNFDRWRILGTYVWPNNFVGQTHALEINYLKNWINNRLTWMDSQWLITTGLSPEEESGILSVYPNPATSYINVQLNSVNNGEFSVSLFDMHGVEVFKGNSSFAGTEPFRMNIGNLSPGFYLLRITGHDQKIYTGKVIRQ
jgi:hypothetical protein